MKHDAFYIEKKKQFIKKILMIVNTKFYLEHYNENFVFKDIYI